MLDAPVGEVGDVQQPLDAAEVDERAVRLDARDAAAHLRVHGELRARLLRARLALALEHRTTRDDDAAAFAVDLEHLAHQRLVRVRREVLDVLERDLRGRHERARRTELELEPALVQSVDRALDERADLELVPARELARLLHREDPQALLAPDERHVERRARRRDRVELRARDGALNARRELDDDVLAGDAGDDRPVEGRVLTGVGRSGGGIAKREVELGAQAALIGVALLVHARGTGERKRKGRAILRRSDGRGERRGSVRIFVMGRLTGRGGSP